VLVSSGFDASDGDPVGDCSIHPETYGHMTSHLLNLANGKVCIVMEGGRKSRKRGFYLIFTEKCHKIAFPSLL
jgi:acetoin utilization deacetylase AcuC-like enzyme